MEICYDKKTVQEKKQIYTMYQEIFHDPEAFADYYFQYLYPKNRVLKLIKDKRLASMIHLNPYTLVWNGREIPANYIVAVSTLSCYRRQGMMAELLKNAMKDMVSKGELFTYLIPAKEAYYTPFDFAFVMDWEEGQIELEDNWKREQGLEYQIQQVTPSMYREAAQYLNKLRGKHFSLWVKADEAYMEQQDAEMKSEGGGLYLIVKEGRYEGFFFCTMGENSLSCTNMWIPEEMTAEEWKRMLYETFGKEEIEFCLPGPGCKRDGWGTKPVPKIMVRILCLKAFLEQMRGKREVSLNLFVEDRFLPENEGCFTWKLGRKESQLLPCEEEPEWRVGIRELTELLFGHGSKEEKLVGAPEKVSSFFDSIRPICAMSITEQV